jgi:hypothetical protein
MRFMRGAALLALVSCGGSDRPPSNMPSSQTDTTGVVVEGGPARPGDPSSASARPIGDVKATSGSVASPMEGACPRGAPWPSAVDAASCAKSCRGLDDQVPLGSRCTSPMASCIAQCGAAFERERR